MTTLTRKYFTRLAALTPEEFAARKRALVQRTLAPKPERKP